VRVTVVSSGRQLHVSNGENEYYCLLQKELRNEHERRTEDELSKQREFINLKTPRLIHPRFFSIIHQFLVFFFFQSVTCPGL